MMSRFLVPFQSSSRSMSDPFNDLHREMNRLLEDFAGGAAPALSGSSGGLMAMPRMDVRESQQEICVMAELPGVKPSEVDLRVEGNVLTIRGEKKNEVEQNKEDYHVMERSYGRFQRSVQLPYAPDPDQVKAEFEHGLLTVHVPKQPQQERSRRIQIQGTAEEAQPKVSGPSGQTTEPPQGQGQPGDVTHH